MKYFFELSKENELDQREENELRGFYRQIPLKGHVGNKALRRRLRLSDADYWRYHQILLQGEKIILGKGRGGSVRRAPTGKRAEKDLEEPICREIEDRWAKDRGYDFRKARVTARQGRRATGEWSRPDITLLAGRSFANLPVGRLLDVVTFEIKPWIGLKGVYESLAHQRRANLSYLICYYAEHKSLADDKWLSAAEREAHRVGTGLIIAHQEDDCGRWKELVSPRRHEPDPRDLHEFLEEQMGKSLKELRDWLVGST